MPGFLRPNQIREMENEKQVLERQSQDPLIEDKGAVRKSLQQLEAQLECYVPPDLRGDKLDNAVREEKELREKIVSGMLTQEEMRRNPPGAVGHNVRFHKRHKQDILRWKDLRLAIHKERGVDDPDVANLEQYRPARRAQALNMDGAQIPQKTLYDFPSPIYRENYEEINWQEKPAEPTTDQQNVEALEAIRAELEQLKAERAAAGIEAPCGRVAKNKTGLLAHMRHCKKCGEER